MSQEIQDSEGDSREERRFDPQRFGLSVARKMRRCSISFRALQKTTGIDQATLHRIVHGQTPSVENYLRLLDFLRT